MTRLLAIRTCSSTVSDPFSVQASALDCVWTWPVGLVPDWNTNFDPLPVTLQVALKNWFDVVIWMGGLFVHPHC